MKLVGTVLRWIAAIIVAVLGAEAGFVIAGFIYIRVGGSPATAYLWQIALATILMTCLGSIVVPKPHRKVASYVFAGVAIAVCAVLSLRAWVLNFPMTAHALEVIGSVLGAAISFRILRWGRIPARAARSIIRRDPQLPEGR